MMLGILAVGFLLHEHVAFHLSAPNAKEVMFAGDYTSWQSPKKMDKRGDAWYFDADVPADGRIEYKFIVDGNWILDPANPVRMQNGVGGENSVWQGPRYRLNAPDGIPNHPMIRKEISVAGRPVILFNPSQSKGLPILIYGDGADYEARAKVQNIVENLAEAGRIRHVVLVLIPPKDRTQEYWKSPKPYEDFVVNDVLPEVRKQTGASERTQDVFVGGSSLGGTISLRLAEDYPDKIAGGVHAQSGAFWVDHGLVSRSELSRLAQRTRLFFDFGVYEQELTAINEAAVKTLESMHRAFGSRETPEGHNWTAWRHRYVEGICYLLGK